MVFFLKEENAKKIFKRYKDVTAYTYVKSRKPSADVRVEFDYLYLKEILPTPDEISAVVSDGVPGKRYIKKMRKAVTNPFNDNPRDIAMCVSVASIVNMLTDSNMKRPRVFVFIAENEEGETARRTRAANKFVFKWLEAMFGAFDIPVINDKGFSKVKYTELGGMSFKKLMKKKKSKDIRRALRSIIEQSNSVRNISMLKCVNIACRMEMIYQNINNMIAGLGTNTLENMGKKTRSDICSSLVLRLAGLSRENYNAVIIPDPDKKNRDKAKSEAEKLLKKYQKKAKKSDKEILEYYNMFRRILEEIRRANDAKGSQINVPMLPGVKKKKLKRKKDLNKLTEKLAKKKNIVLVSALIAHICVLRAGADFGSAEHVKAVTEILAIQDKTLANQFKVTVKAFSDQLNRMGQAQK